MKNEAKVKNSFNHRKHYLSEFEIYDGERFITFNIIDIDTVRNEITVAMNDQGRISVCTFSLLSDTNDLSYFEYGIMFERIALDDFTQEVWQYGND